MEYEKIIEEIEHKRRFGNLPGVVISEQLLAAVGNPQHDLPFIHIAGTNGKGSTAAFLSGICKQAGLKTGLFTSPHLISFTERIQINGQEIDKETAARLGERLLALKEEVSGTMFDYCLAMALLYFKEEKCDLVILETGLGGRLDSTNAVGVPKVSVITKIGYDHTQILGDNLAMIAREKAGILKEGTMAVLESQCEEVLRELTNVCIQKKIPYRIVESDKIVWKEGGFSYHGEQERSFRMNMNGSYQTENAMAAVFAAEALRSCGFRISTDAILCGIENAFWPGRMELISRKPFFMLDGAHNSNGTKALAKSLKEQYPNEKFHFLTAVLADKDYREMMQDMLPIAKDVVAFTPDSNRALQAEDLAEYIKSQGIPAKVETDIRQKIEAVLGEDGDSFGTEKTIAFGSLYFIGNIRKIIKERI